MAIEHSLKPEIRLVGVSSDTRGTTYRLKLFVPASHRGQLVLDMKRGKLNSEGCETRETLKIS